MGMAYVQLKKKNTGSFMFHPSPLDLYLKKIKNKTKYLILNCGHWINDRKFTVFFANGIKPYPFHISYKERNVLLVMCAFLVSCSDGLDSFDITCITCNFFFVFFRDSIMCKIESRILRFDDMLSFPPFSFNLHLWFLVQNARCGAEQTQTVTREAPAITHIPGKEKTPQLDDGGSRFPPRDEGDGGGVGGDGGNWSGGFFFFGFLAFLGFLEDKESEGPYRE